LIPEPLILFGFPIHLFGLFASLGLLIGIYATGREMVRLQIPKDLLMDLAFAIMIPAFLSARLLFIFVHHDFYFSSPLNIIKFWEGGLILYGGLLGGLTGGFLFCRSRQVSFLKLGDAVALGLAIGFAVSRLGCLFAGCCYGKPTSVPWGIVFTHPMALAPLNVALHPTQIYDFFLELGIYWILLSMRARKTFNGEILLLYFILAPASRLLLEQFRADSHFITRLLAGAILAVAVSIECQLKTRKGKSMKPKLKLAALVLAAVFFTACGIVRTQTLTRGHDIKSSDVDRIVKGTTTEKDLLKLFGPPTKVRDSATGKEFYYEYTQSGGPQWNLLISVGGGTTTKTLLVWMDKNGVVTDYAYKKN